jgi:UDPglucose--hexose-1-phosphate uridylyltransferase
MSESDQPHRRYNPLTDRWVLVSPQRTQRPWDGQTETTATAEPHYLPDCYLCPGNVRAGGAKNPAYEDVYVFDNDFPALLDGKLPQGGDGGDPLLRREAVRGRCRVICYSPRHDLTMASMDAAALRRVIDTWSREIETLSEHYRWVQVFENRGAAMGCSNMHPHGQIWSLDVLPSEVAVEDRQQAAHLARSGQPLLCVFAARELELDERVVVANEHWVALVPWWATWPFELLLLPRRHVAQMPDLDDAQRDALAAILGRSLRSYDRLFATPFPYSMGWHGAPAGGEAHWQLHAHFYPPLLRSATVRKHMVGFEMLGESQRDLTPELAAQRLRDVLSDLRGATGSWSA